MSLLEWCQDNQTALYWGIGTSVVLCAGTLFAAPALIARMPADYFTHEKRPKGQWENRLPLPRSAVVIARNILGYLLMIAGVAMLVLPGQGFLTIFIGFLLVDFPGKYRLEKWLVSWPRVLRGMNWIRRKRGKAPMKPPPHRSPRGRRQAAA